jgi:hypothetical protein
MIEVCGEKWSIMSPNRLVVYDGLASQGGVREERSRTSSARDNHEKRHRDRDDDV